MVDDRDLPDLDPYDLMDHEAERLDAFFSGLDESGWRVASRCAGWSVRDVLAHLCSGEDYHRACLDGTVRQLLEDMAAKGATDLATANDIGIRERATLTNEELLASWRSKSATSRRGFRARDGGTVDTTVGDYPARWQAFHVAVELATHADDVGAPVSPEGHRARTSWRAQFGRFALAELNPEVVIEPRAGGMHVRAGDVDVDLTDEEFVDAVSARLPDDHDLDPRAAAALSATP